MQHLVLARKYRPKSFAEMVGQAHVVTALTNALVSGRLHHAYLFTGTRGVGKTTVSRILAKSLNCVGADGQGGITATPCGVCEACSAIDAGRFVDYTELDAASNRGVDEVQSLLEQAVYKPVAGRYKVFMIDEVHMLTTTAFNAMLKTLEEPPEYLKFVLATTDPQKIPVTVLSRCLQFNLRPMAPETVQEHLQKVLAQENIQAEAGALKLLARGAHGSMRDALSLTDQAIAFGAGSLSEAGVRQMLGAVDSSFVLDAIDALAKGDGQRVVAIADSLREAGVSAAFALEDMARVLQKMAVYQALGPAASGAAEAASDDAEEQATLQLAQTMPADETQLLYSMAIHGRAELGLAPDEYAGLVMTLLRLLAFKPAGFVPVQGGAAPVDVSAAEKKTLNKPASNAIETEAAQAGSTPENTENTLKNQAAPVAVPQGDAGTAESTGAAYAIDPDSDPSPIQEPGLEPRAQDAADASTAPALEMQAFAPPAPAALQLPVREMAAPPSRLEQSKHSAGDAAAQAQWLALVQQLLDAGAVQALQRELAIQSQCVAQGADWRTLRVEQSALRADSVREKLQAALAAAGQACLLRVELGEVQDSWAKRQQAAQSAQQAEAEASFAALPLVQHLLQDWGGKILPGSVQVAP